MNKKIRKSLKGFTLVELIVVIAIFGLLMAATLSLLMPTFSVQRRATEYALTAEVVDNTRMAVEDRLRYANRMAVYVGPDIGADPADTVEVLENKAVSFSGTKANELRSKFLLDAMDAPKSGKKRTSYAKDEVYVMRIHNPSEDEFASGVAGGALRPGKISLWKFKEGGSFDSDNSKDWIFSEDLYGDYSFSLWFGSGITYEIEEEMYLQQPKMVITKGTYSPVSNIPPSAFNLNLDIYTNNYPAKESADKKTSSYKLYKSDVSSRISLAFMNMGGGAVQYETITYLDSSDGKKKTMDVDRYSFNPGTASKDIYIVYTLPDF